MFTRMENIESWLTQVLSVSTYWSSPQVLLAQMQNCFSGKGIVCVLYKIHVLKSPSSIPRSIPVSATLSSLWQSTWTDSLRERDIRLLRGQSVMAHGKQDKGNDSAWHNHSFLFPFFHSVQASILWDGDNHCLPQFTLSGKPLKELFREVSWQLLADPKSTVKKEHLSTRETGACVCEEICMRNMSLHYSWRSWSRERMRLNNKI